MNRNPEYQYSKKRGLCQSFFWCDTDGIPPAKKNLFKMTCFGGTQLNSVRSTFLQSRKCSFPKCKALKVNDHLNKLTKFCFELFFFLSPSMFGNINFPTCRISLWSYRRLAGPKYDHTFKQLGDRYRGLSKNNEANVLQNETCLSCLLFNINARKPSQQNKFPACNIFQLPHYFWNDP